jgi:transposase-like protein
MSTPTDTPRTDAATFTADTYTGDRKVVDPDDMAEIERELTDAKAEFERLANPCGWPHCEPAKADAAELARLRAEVERRNDIIKRASMQFFHDGTDGEAAAKMLTVLNEAAMKEASK